MKLFTSTQVKIILTAFAVYVSFVAGFVTFYTFNLLYPTKAETGSINVCSPPINLVTKDLALTDFDILVVTEDLPHKIFHINHLDNKVENYAQSQLEYSLDGTNIKQQSIEYSAVKWEQLKSNGDNSQYTISANFKLGTNVVEISIPSIFLNTVVRAQPTVGKYAGSTLDPNVEVTLNGQTHKAYAGVTAGFFNDFTPVDIYKLQVHTHWLMFFDKDWNFYHLDVTDVKYPTESYYSHKFYSIGNNATNAVNYAKDIVVSSDSASALTVDYSLAHTPITNIFSLKAFVVPYTDAKLYLAGDAHEGVGIYMTINSADSKSNK